jgi:hypothetical protein
MTAIDESVSLSLLLGQPVNVYGVNIYSPTLKEIVSIGYDTYNYGLSSLLFEKSLFEDLKEINESNYDLMIHFFNKDKGFKKSLEDGSRLIFKEEIKVDMVNGRPYFVLGDSFIDREPLDEIQRMIKIANRIPDKKSEDEFNPGNSQARKLIEKILTDRAKRAPKKQNVNLHSIVSGLAWKSNSLNILNIINLTIYQIYDGYYRMENIDHYNGILTGIYTGNIDSSKIKLQDSAWTKIIDQ